MKQNPEVGIIGGSGLYQMEGVENIEEHNVSTPFGGPSSSIMVGNLEGLRVAFLARHGQGHIYSPSEVNYKANIYALKSLGVQRIISVSASGSLREDYQPGNLVVPDQLFDFTKKRESTYFSKGLVAHIGVADPFCESFSNQIFEGVSSTQTEFHRGGTFITVEGPRFSTKAESHIFRSWGMSLIGMTTSPEAFLAREAELCYGVIAHVTDYDVWHKSEAPVTAQQVFKTLKTNIIYAQEAIKNIAKNYDALRDCDCDNTLKPALSTNIDSIPSETKEELELLIKKYLK